MYKIAKLPEDERRDLFQNTALIKGVNPAVVEKDFWVCLVLDYLFHDKKWNKRLAFKGGTCLSKAYGLIERFSEDIDLILDWRILGYGIDEPWEERSNTKQQLFIEDSRRRLYFFLREIFVPELRQGLESAIGKHVNVGIDELDEGIVNFVYPSIYQDSSILKVIRLELGALAAWTPTQIVEITSYAAENIRHCLKRYLQMYWLQHLNDLFGRRLQYYIMKHLDRNTPQYQQDTQGIIMTCIVCQRLVLKIMR